MTGPIIRHGPHHGAQQSRSTGTGDASTFNAKSASVTITGCPVNNSSVLMDAPHFPHFGVSPILSEGILFFVPHAVHRIMYEDG
jgi:hypothetical protein